jgi:hypothetical protein
MRDGWMRHTAVILGCVAIFAVTAAAMSWPWWEYAFLSDDSPMAWLSSALLLASAAIALSLSVSRSLPSRFGGLLAGALACLALDEQFRLQERMKVAPAAGVRRRDGSVCDLGGSRKAACGDRPNRGAL